MAVDRVGARDVVGVPVDLVGDDLVPVDVPVGPAVVGPTAVEAEHLTVEVPGGLDVVDRDREMEGRDRGGAASHVAMIVRTR